MDMAGDTLGIYGWVDGVVVGLQVSVEAGQQSAGHVSAATGMVVVEHDLFMREATEAYPHVGFALRRLVRLLEHLYRGSIALDDGAGSEPVFHQVQQGLYQLAAADDPIGQGAAGKINAMATEDLLLTGQRQCILVFGDGDLGQQAGTGIALGDRLGRQRCGIVSLNRPR